MQTLSHGSDLRLAPTIRPIADQHHGSPRRALAVLAEAGFAAVQLDATMPGLRPRELDKTARRDLVTTARRSDLTLAGLDLFIPPDHYHDPAHLDRAAAALLAACQLAADLGRIPLTLNLPAGEADPALVRDLLAAADGCGTPLVICHAQPADELASWIRERDSELLAAAIDPASLLIARIDPAQAAQALSGHLGVARLSDASRGQSDSRCTVGRGDLDLLAYRVSVDLAGPKYGPVVLDLRSLSTPTASAQHAQQAWQNAVV